MVLGEDAAQLDYILPCLRLNSSQRFFAAMPELSANYKELLEEIVGERVGEDGPSIPWLFDDAKPVQYAQKVGKFRATLANCVDSDDEQAPQRAVPGLPPRKDSSPAKPPTKAGRPKGSTNKDKSGTAPQQRAPAPQELGSEDEQRLLDRFRKCKNYVIKWIHRPPEEVARGTHD